MVRDPGHDKAIQEAYELVAESALPDHWKSGYTADDFETRRREFIRTLGEIIEKTLLIARPREQALTILDVGCGNGAYTESVIASGRAVFGADLSPTLIKEALQRCPALRGCVATCYALPFPDGAFDIVYSLGVLQALADRSRYLQELVRVLRPRGVGLIEFLPKWNLVDACARAAFHLAKLDARAARADFAMLKSAGPAWRGITIFRTAPQEVRKMLVRAGATWARVITKRFLFFNSHYSTVLFSR